MELKSHGNITFDFLGKGRGNLTRAGLLPARVLKKLKRNAKK